tara:strand:- start:2935 stop:4305 length:1371 start_codon:yes stop_codon:yes gene_type:complete
MINQNSNNLQKLYLAFFGRPGDPSGINYWLNCLNESLTMREISQDLSTQEEYKYFAFDKSFRFQIDRIYLNLFNRNVNLSELNYWTQRIDNSSYNISDIVYDLVFPTTKSNCTDLKQKNIDSSVLYCKILAAEIFTKKINQSIILRNLYQPESINPWVNSKSFEKVSDFLFNINLEEVSQEKIDKLINSFSDVSIEALTTPAIEIKDISLSIPINYIENRSFTKKFANKVINFTGGKLDQSNNKTNIIALNKINLTIMKGERIGLIGHNGSGKSSFLRLISGIYLPTSGHIKVLVNVYPMLQKTFLTSSELSGIDACKAHYLLKNHCLEGFEYFLNEIIDFSGLGSYISLPVKTYSEGMSARLIFSILTSSPHECLAIDEGFGTGDADFCDRAEARMKQFMESASTLFLASHSEELLRQFCNRGIVFRHGSIVFDGPLDDALNYYNTSNYCTNVIR